MTLVDWGLAERLAPALVLRGPHAGSGERERLVDTLRSAAERALPHAARVTRLDRVLTDLDASAGPTLVVDRAGWARANVQSFAAIDPGRTDGGPTGPADRLRLPTPGGAGAVEVAAALGMLSGSVLGQVDPWGATRPRLLLVAPNVLATRRAMGADPDDYALWVALHEQAHMLQLAAAPWLAGHLAAGMRRLLADPGLRPTLRATVDGVRRAVRQDGWSAIELLPATAQVTLADLGAVLALMEGHADVAMDAVGPSVVPSVRTLRRRSDRRRSAAARATGPLATGRRVLRAVLGVDVKMAQYRDGARFVRRVRRAVGTDGLNLVWTAPELLPTPAEIADPTAWLHRVHG